MRIPSSTALVLSSIVAGFVAGCPVDPATLTPQAPSLDLAEGCRTVNSIRVEGEKPAGVGIVGAATDASGETTEFEVVAVDDATEFSGAVVLPADGTYDVAFVAETSSGVRSKAVGPFRIVVDRAPPAAPVCTVPEPVEVASDPVTVDVACEFGDDVANVEVDGVDVGRARRTVPVVVAQGTNTHAVVALDSCGNRSTAVSISSTGADDLTPPTGLTVDGPAEATIGEGAETALVDFGGAKEAGSSVAYAICPIDGCPEGTTTTDLPGDAAATTWTAALPLPAGLHLLAFVARDAANNTSGPVTHEIRVRAFIAVPTLSSPPPAATNAQVLSLSGNRQAGTRVLAQIAGSAEPVVLDDGSVDGGTTWTGELDISSFVDVPVSPRPLNFSLFADDGAIDGDRSADGDAVRVLIDRTAPEAPVVTLVDDVFRLAPGVASASFPFNGRGESATTIVVDGVDSGTVTSSGVLAFQKTLTPTTTAVVVALRDAAGNLSEATTLSVSVVSGLFAPVLTSPPGSRFPVFTREATLTLTGTRPANCGTGPCGVEAVSAADGTTVTLAPIGSTTTWTGALPLVEGGNRFFLRAFDAATPPNKSDLVGLTPGEPFTAVKDTTPPAPPEPVVPQGTQAATVSFPILKGADDGLLMRANDELVEITLAPVLDGLEVYSLVGQALVPGENRFCFVTIDRVGNRSDDGDGEPVCIVVSRAIEATLTLNRPQRNDVINGSTLRVEATLDRSATSFSVCVNDACQDVAGNNTSLAATVNIGPAPAAAEFATVRVCGTDGASQGCATTTILRWPAPFVVAQGVFDSFKPQVAVDRNGFLHVVWEDENLDRDLRCVAPHMDVVTQAARGTSGPALNRLVITLSRAEGFAVGDTFRLAGAGGFDGTYRISSLNRVTRTLTTQESVAPGLPPQTTGNVFGVAPYVACAGPDIFYRRFDDQGWSDVVNLSDIGFDNASTAPSIAVDEGNNVHVVWQEDGDMRELFGDLSNGGAEEASGIDQKPDIVHRVIDGLSGVIGLPSLVTPNNSANDTQTNGSVSLATGAGDVVAVWQETATIGAAGSIWMSRFGAGVWQTRQLIAAGTGLTPAVAVGASRSAYVVWSDTRATPSATDRDIVLCRVRLNDNGCDSARRTIVTDGPDAGVSTFPRVAVDNGRSGTADDDSVHVVWLDTGNGTNAPLTPDPLVYQRRFRPERILGATVSGITRVSDTDDATIYAPALAAHPGSSRVFVAWASSGTFVGAARPVARSVGTDRDLFGLAIPGPDGVFESSGFAAPSLLVGAVGNNLDADAVDVAATSPDGRNAYVVFGDDPDFATDPQIDLGANANAIVIHAVPMQ